MGYLKSIFKLKKINIMKANLVKELESSLLKRKSANEKNDVLNEVKRLLEYDTLQDVHILRSIGQNSTLAQSETERGAVLEIEKKEQFYSGKVFTKEQIVTLAVKYRLKFLQSKHYTKYIPPSVIPEIKEMQRHISNQMNVDRAKRENCTLEEYLEKTDGFINYTIDDSCLKNNFYILAPGNMFKLEKAATFSIKAKDPVMFYTDDNQHFRLVKKWGSDFTIFRRVLGWLTKSVSAQVFLYLSLFTAITLLLSIAVSWYFMFLWLALAFGCIITFGPCEVEIHEDFAGKNYTTSTKRFYM
jgi:hypothetical protein